MKKLLPFLFIFNLLISNSSPLQFDYFRQTTPDSTPVIFAPNIISINGRLEHGLSFSPDGTELAFGILDPNDYKGAIYYAKKSNNGWSEPTHPAFIGEGSFFLPYFTPDGKSMLFAKSKPDSTIYDYTDIWIITKQNGIYTKPHRLNEPVSSFTRDANASMTLDGTIYLASNRACPDGQCFADIYYAKPVNGKYLQTKMVTNISLKYIDEESVFIAPNEDYIITCGFTNNETWMDLYISYRDINGEWLKPRLADTSINSLLWDRRPFVSIDNKYLFYTRLNIGKNGISESDIYWVSTSRLFKPYVYNPISDTTITVNEKLEISIPANCFKDIDDDKLTLSINKNKHQWISYDSEKMTLTGTPIHEGDYPFTIIATDNLSNSTEHTFKISVIKAK